MEEENQIIEEKKSSDIIISQLSINYLKDTSPWMKFISIIGLIGCGFLIFIAIFILVFPFPTNNASSASLMIGMKSMISVIYIILAVVLIFPHIYLLNYANRIKKFVNSNDYVLLEKAFAMQKRFWLYIGILIIINLSFTVIFFFAGVAGGLLTSLFMR